MFKNYFKVALRNAFKNKTHSLINIVGLAVGMTVAMLIGLWIYDELSFNKNHTNYARLGQVWQFVNFSGSKAAYSVMPAPMAAELRTKYPDFQSVCLSSGDQDLILASGETKLARTGDYVEPEFTEMMSLKMMAGDRGSLKDIHSILLSASLAKSLFGAVNPIGQVVSLNADRSLKVTGVYEDFPNNSSFKDLTFLASWDLYVATSEFAKNSLQQWDNNSFSVYVLLKPSADFNQVSAKIRDIRMKKDNPPGYKPEFFVHPMSRWHLYLDFKNGVNTGGLIMFVWLFGIIGVFVLLLACINFMNLSTARSEKRAKEVGIRKSIGSLRWNLLVQFFSESLLMSFLAFACSVVLVSLALPFFNQLADKKMSIPWSNPLFWLIGIGFSGLTGLIAGSYPALYLSSFQPVKVLKGTFRAGRLASIPRKVLVVVQFTVSVILILGTIVVFRQIQYAKQLPSGYNRNGLIEMDMNTPDMYKHAASLRNDLVQSGAVESFSASSCSITHQNGGATNVFWKGKAPNTQPLLMSNNVTGDFGKTVVWQVSQGRDFSKAFATDSSAIILNEAAVKLMAFKNPIGELVKYANKDFTVIGVVKDMIRESPFQPVKPSFFILTQTAISVIQIKLPPQAETRTALAKVEAIFRKYNPASPFQYRFVDENYAKKFMNEERIGQLASCFAILAIFISCLGLFGLASFVAEQRTKEIGVRKVLGASLFNVWQLLSREFILLVLISLAIAIPVAYYFMNIWLHNYEYHSELSWWIFVAAGGGALLITLLTVSYQGIRAALMNPMRSLRTE